MTENKKGKNKGTNKNTSATKTISFAGLFAAMVFALTMLHVPVGIGYVHFGDAIIYLCSALLGGPFSLLAAAFGAAVADIVSGAAAYALASAIIKALICLPFVLFCNRDSKLLTLKSALLTILSGAITVGGYYVADLIIYKKGAVADIPGNIVQAAGSAVLFIILAFALDRVKIKDRFNGFFKSSKNKNSQND